MGLHQKVSLAQTDSSTAKVAPAVKAWLDESADERKEFSKQPFAQSALNKQDSKTIQQMLWDDYVLRMKKEREQEWREKKITLDKLTMKFEYKVFGKKPRNGRSLFLSMHGGGNAPTRVNDQQWQNQISLYRPKEGVYVAPRAPTDTWNLWHQSHIDQFFKRIILDAMLFEDVNPNRVYIMGYSAGGDGVYQLAPRMADTLAAAAMMAGHPNDASPLGLRNIGFTIHMGAKDAAYKRNQIAADWKVKLAELQKDDPEGYKHDVVIHENMGHWMKRKDAVAVPWMAKFTRDPAPKKIVWNVNAALKHDYYWLAASTNSADEKPNNKKPAGSKIVASREGQSFTIVNAEGAHGFSLQLNDEIADLDKPIEIKMADGTSLKSTAKRTPNNIFDSIERLGDPARIYSATIPVLK